MATVLIDEEKLKEILKSAIIEILEERKDLVRDLFEEALEDVALTHAIEEGERSKTVSRDEIFSVPDAPFNPLSSSVAHWRAARACAGEWIAA